VVEGVLPGVADVVGEVTAGVVLVVAGGLGALTFQ
jgi:hypothetical protein